MNVAQRKAFEELEARTGHSFSAPRYSPIHVTVRCTCGWEYAARRGNALARSSRMYGAMRKHLLDKLEKGEVT